MRQRGVSVGPATACAHLGHPPHQLGVQVEATGEEQHGHLPVFLLQALMASMVAVGAGGTGGGAGPDLGPVQGIQLGLREWVGRRGTWVGRQEG